MQAELQELTVTDPASLPPWEPCAEPPYRVLVSKDLLRLAYPSVLTASDGLVHWHVPPMPGFPIGLYRVASIHDLGVMLELAGAPGDDHFHYRNHYPQGAIA